VVHALLEVCYRVKEGLLEQGIYSAGVLFVFFLPARID